MTEINLKNQAISISRCRLISIGIPMLKIRRSWDRLFRNMGIPTPGKDGFKSKWGPVAAGTWSGNKLCSDLKDPAGSDVQFRYIAAKLNTTLHHRYQSFVFDTLTKWSSLRSRHFQINLPEWKVRICIQISLNFVPRSPINNKLALAQIMEPMMVYPTDAYMRNSASVS